MYEISNTNYGKGNGRKWKLIHYSGRERECFIILRWEWDGNGNTGSCEWEGMGSKNSIPHISNFYIFRWLIWPGERSMFADLKKIRIPLFYDRLDLMEIEYVQNTLSHNTSITMIGIKVYKPI